MLPQQAIQVDNRDDGDISQQLQLCLPVHDELAAN